MPWNCFVHYENFYFHPLFFLSFFFLGLPTIPVQYNTHKHKLGRECARMCVGLNINRPLPHPIQKYKKTTPRNFRLGNLEHQTSSLPLWWSRCFWYRLQNNFPYRNSSNNSSSKNNNNRTAAQQWRLMIACVKDREKENRKLDGIWGENESDR